MIRLPCPRQHTRTTSRRSEPFRARSIKRRRSYLIFIPSPLGSTRSHRVLYRFTYFLFLLGHRAGGFRVGYRIEEHFDPTVPDLHKANGPPPLYALAVLFEIPARRICLGSHKCPCSENPSCRASPATEPGQSARVFVRYALLGLFARPAWRVG